MGKTAKSQKTLIYMLLLIKKGYAVYVHERKVDITRLLHV
jgi:hypothetical protein